MHKEDYSKQEYWQERYSCEKTPYEWFESAKKEFVSFLTTASDSKSTIIPHGNFVLNLGCGSSHFSRDLYEADNSLFFIDMDYASSAFSSYSPTALHCDRVVGDARTALLRPECFDVVLDKATLDAVFSDGSSQWDPSSKTRLTASQILNQLKSTLKSSSGIYVCISFGQPHFRMPYLQEAEWRLIKQHPPINLYWIYECLKQ